MYICRIAYDEPLAKIGIEFGGKTHTTVMHSVNKIKDEIENNSNLEIEFQKLIKQIN